jgi:transposase-like protein
MFNSEQKMQILRELLLERKSMATICEKHALQPTQVYKWQQELFENGKLAFERESVRDQKIYNMKIEELQSKLAHKTEVMFELMEEHVKLKKSLGVK